MTFAAPIWFWSFVTFPFLIALGFANERRRENQLALIVASRLMPRLAGTVSLARRRLIFFFTLLGLAGLIVTLARPQWGFTWEQSKRKGRDVLLAIDTSRSMLADDIKPNRLTRAKFAAQDLISLLHSDRIGVVAFAGTAFLQAPLTVDYTAVTEALQELDTEAIPQGGTNLAGALRAAVEAFGKGESENRALVVFSDGEELDADAKAALDELNGKVRIFAVGVGTPEGALIPVPNKGGGTAFVKDDAGNVVRSKLDESRLRAIAEATGGFYVRLQTGRPEMQQIVNEGLGKMAENEIDARMSRRPIERFQWPLSFALICTAVAGVLGDRRKSAVRVAAAALFIVSPFSTFAKNTALESYERKEYEQSRDEFSRQLKRQPSSSKLQYDVGAAAYKAGDLDTALSAFSGAVTSSDPGIRAKAAYNLGNTLFQRGVKQEKKDDRVAEWKNAIQHYDAALKIEPNNEKAIYNRDLIKKLLEEQEQKDKQDQQKKDDQKDDQKQDQQKKQDQKKDDQEKQEGQQKNDQKDQQGQDQQPKPDQGQDQKDSQQQSKGEQGEGKGSKDQPQSSEGDQGEQKPDDSKDGSDKPQKGGEKKDGDVPESKEGKDGKNEEGQREKPDQSKLPPPQPKKEGDLKPATPNGQNDQPSGEDQAAEASAEAAAAAAGKMTERQAKALLDSLKSEDDKVRLTDPLERRANRRVLKDW